MSSSTNVRTLNGPTAAGQIATPISTVSATVSAIGQFEFDNVAPGNYSLCVVPNDRTHINSCNSPNSGAQSVSISTSNALIQPNLSAGLGVPILLTTVLAKSTGKMPTNVFLGAADGRFFPMQNDGQPGHFWAVVPPQLQLRVSTTVAGGAVSLPAEIIQSGSVGIPVVVTVSR